MRSIYCGQLNLLHINQEVTLCGWVDCRRDLGGIIFINMRDREGIVQIFFDPKYKELFSLATELRNEYCLQLTGIVRIRPNNKFNKNVDTGNIEVLATNLIIINRSDPIPINFYTDSTEEQRLKFRYLDLRRPIMMNRLKIRANVSRFIRRFMDNEGFIDIETPMLTKSIPEGARDYLIFSKENKEKFYALPQSPQLFKQLLMISGFDRYYQIVKCFRDEDLRADRQPEFTQVDIEASFLNAEKIREIVERLIHNLWYDITNVNLGTFKIITYSDSMLRFGSDKPDLRNPMELINIEDLVKNIEFNMFSFYANNENGRVSALNVPGGAKLSRKQIDKYTKYVSIYGVKELFWIKVHRYNSNTKRTKSLIEKILGTQIIEQIIIRTKAIDGDIIFIIANYNNIVSSSLGSLRVKLGLDLKITKIDSIEPIWIIDFPMFKKKMDGKLHAMHHPFTAPKNIDHNLFKINPIKLVSDAYDLVINGNEIGSGSVRIHSFKIQKIIFDILKINEHEQENKFGFFLRALKYGTPPHAGIALGFDRLIMLLTNTNNIRNVIAFPKTTSASDLMMESPNYMYDLI